MHLGIVAQRLKVADADGWRCDRLLINDAALVKRYLHAKAFCNQAGQDLKLHLAHELHMDLAQPLVPHHAQQGFFLLQLAQVLQHGVGIAALRQDDPVIQHRLEHCRHSARCLAQPHTGARMRQAGHRADHTALRALHCLKFFAGVNADLIDLFLPATVRFPGHLRAHRQAAARDLEIGQAVALRIPRDLEHLRAERIAVLRRTGIAVDPVQQFAHTVQLEGRSEIARKCLTGRDKIRDITRLYGTG